MSDPIVAPPSSPPLFLASRKRHLDDDVPVFSSDPLDASIDIENAPKRLYRGPWWNHSRSNGSYTRNFDSGVHFPSDDSLPEHEVQLESFISAIQTTPSTSFSTKSLDHASRIVDEALEENNEVIDLSGIDMEAIPSDLLERLQILVKAPRIIDVNGSSSPLGRPQFHSLKPELQIFLSNNLLTSLSPSLWNLESLTVLSLRNNAITSLPSSISRLTNLVELNVANNQLAYLPFELLQLIGPETPLKKLLVLPNPFVSDPGMKIPGYSTDLHFPHTVGEYLQVLNVDVPAMLNDRDDKTGSPLWWRRRLMSEIWLLLRNESHKPISRAEDPFSDCKSILYPLRPLFIAASKVFLFRIDGSPMDKDMTLFAPDGIVQAVLDSTLRSQPPKPPSLLELAVKACSAYPDISSIEAMLQDGPPPVASAISHIQPARDEGGRIMFNLDWSFTNSHQFHLFAIAIISTGFTAATIFGTQELRRQIRIQKLKDSAPNGEAETLTEYGAAAESSTPNKEDDRNAALALRARQGDYDEDLILEQLARNRVFLTDEGLKKLRSAFIIVVGCGGVGSHTAAALARSGVSKLRLIDFDQVTLSSLNRHAVATLADVGTPKVHAIRKRLEAITPWVRFDCRNELFGAGVASSQLEPLDGQKPDFVIDAIDNIDSKVALLHYCYSNSMKVISAMGAGAKSDPTRIFIGDISATTDDPLSKSTRVRLRQLGVSQGIPVVFSSEKWSPGKAELLPLPEDEFVKGNIGELGVLQNFRVRIMPVLGTMPAIFGLAVANHVMLDVCGYPHEYLQSKARGSTYSSVLQTLQGQEERLVRNLGSDSVGLRLPIVAEDVGYLLDEIFHAKSVISGLGNRLVLTRWRKPSKLVDDSIPKEKRSLLKLEDLVCMTREESIRHEKLVLVGEQTPEVVYDKGILEMVDRRLQQEIYYERFR